MTDKAVKALTQYLQSLKASGVDIVPSVRSRTAACDAPASSPARQQAPKTDHQGELSQKDALLKLREEVSVCVACSELAETRKSVVFGSGNANARLVFVGEAPGFDEDIQGLPFVGKAGHLLTKIIESIGLTRKNVFICNVLKCRPPRNRNPLPEEISNCQPFLRAQLDIIKPKVICALGSFAARTLLKSEQPISKLRGSFHEYAGSKLLCTFHPAYLLRNPSDKRKVWDDMKMIRAELSES
jgi:uracil-DNA glycosylase